MVVSFLRKLWQRTRRFIPLELAGALLLSAAVLVAFVFAKEEVDAVAYAAALTAIALVLLCLLASGIATAWLYGRTKRSAQTSTLEIETGIETRTGFLLPGAKRIPLVNVELSWVEPSRVTVRLFEEEEAITPMERGRYEGIVRRVTVRDVFGLTSFSFTIESDQDLRIAPGTAPASAPLATSYGPGSDWSQPGGPREGDLVEMRQYGPGDPMRRVLWKTFARSRRLLVRMPEPAFAPQPVNVAFFIAGDDDEASAAIARSFLERGLLGNDFLFAADGATTPARTTADAIEQIIDSVRSRADGGSCLSTLARGIDQGRLSASVLFAPARPGKWIDHVLAFAHRLPASSTVVIGSEHPMEVPAAESRLERVFLDPIANAADILAMRDQLVAAGLRVQVVHRETGTVA